jgi:hypothetical protein
MNEAGFKSRQDIKTMLKRRGEIDLPYLEQQALKLDVQHILDELRTEL